MDNAFFRFMGKVTDLVWLNILTLVCCIPIFTMGAAFTAMYHVLIKIAIKEEGTVTRTFFRAFKANFKNATVVWVPSLIILIIMFSNAYLIYQGVLNPYPKLMIVVGISIGIIVASILMFLNYYFAIISRYQNDLKQYIKNAILMMLAYFPRSLCMLVIMASPIALMTLSNNFLFFWFVYGFSFPGYIIAMLLGSLLLKTERIGQD